MCWHSHAKTKNAKRDTRKYPRPISMQSEHNARAYIPLGRTKNFWAHKTKNQFESTPTKCKKIVWGQGIHIRQFIILLYLIKYSQLAISPIPRTAPLPEIQYRAFPIERPVRFFGKLHFSLRLFLPKERPWAVFRKEWALFRKRI